MTGAATRTDVRREHYCVFDTAIGPCGIAWSERGVTRFQLPEANRDRTETRLRGRARGATPGTPPAPIAQVIEQVRRYFAGERIDFSSVPLDLRGLEPFDRTVCEAARGVGWGETTTYGALAERAGFPGEPRDVGQAMGHNPVPLIIPCHRVLAAGNKVGGFSAYGGTATKERMLALEGVRLGDGQLALPLEPARR
jgi:methylated-DNA-[protein]-cysteine S-methyltransferase